MHGWNIQEGSDDTIVLKKNSSSLVLLKWYAATLFFEWPIWCKYYGLLNPKDRTVLDVGAGCGETAYFFIAKGATKVICLEPDHKACEILRRNVQTNNWPVEVIEEKFGPKHLNLKYDVAKIDCEGGERFMLDYFEPLKPMVIEVHGTELMKSFAQRIPSLQKVHNLNRKTVMLSNVRKGAKNLGGLDVL
jgi:hypothetical protein